jgi:hypothetical protein
MQITDRGRNLLGFLRDNVERGAETVAEAKKFASQVKPDLPEEDRRAVELALRSRAKLRDFCSSHGI